MAASKQWVRDAAEVFLALLGPDLALELLGRLQSVPNPNKSAEQTIKMLVQEVKDRL